MLAVVISNLFEWYWPAQPLSYSVIRPKGAPMPMPSHHFGATWYDRYALGTTPRWPASPLLPPVGAVPPSTVGLRLLPLSRNLNDGQMALAPADTLPPGRYVMPAGLK